MRIAIGCDHGAVALKDKVILHLQSRHYEVADFGTYTSESCDYPEFAGAAAEKSQSQQYLLRYTPCTGFGFFLVGCIECKRNYTDHSVDCQHDQKNRSH